ncbi:hypothetical protein [Massilia sp. 9096]|uniref:hypothetical protein n=1 Tax=Massilia sp. 9096 TaxID=1500894 RepID=UPI0005663131|nr:hypothetical protein [Massilia sp. 9096]
MKKTVAIIVFFLFAVFAWNVFGGNGIGVDIDGDHVDGPLGALLGLVFAGGGMLLAGVVMLFVGVVLAAVFAGVGIMLAGGLALGMALLALAISPLLLPLLLPLAVIWYVFGRSRKQRMLREQAV